MDQVSCVKKECMRQKAGVWVECASFIYDILVGYVDSQEDGLMDVYDELISKREFLAVVGLGYVGMPLAIAFSKKLNVIGFDVNQVKIALYNQGIDPTKEVGDDGIRESGMLFTSDPMELGKAKFIIVAVPTPVREDKTPDLMPVESASRIVGQNLKKGAIVVYESTVYPGVTEDICVPILEEESGMKCGVDFRVGYSPERINPSDKEHVLSNIIKIVSGMDEYTLDQVAKTYELVALAGVHRASSIKVAEAAKVIENSQRDINIAFMNELSIIFHKMGIDTKEVLEAAGTKWNFLKFQPGLVGGHCIGVDPYYLTHKAEQLGYHSQVILAGRRINDGMGKYVAENVVKGLIKHDIHIKNARVAILGFAFKENCQDTRNTKVIDIIRELEEYGVQTIISDEVADVDEAKRLYGIDIVNLREVHDVDAVVVCVQHDKYKKMTIDTFNKMYRNDEKLLFDIKGVYDGYEYTTQNYYYWRL